jgi:hypothetical protein
MTVATFWEMDLGMPYNFCFMFLYCLHAYIGYARPFNKQKSKDTSILKKAKGKKLWQKRARQ